MRLEDARRLHTLADARYKARQQRFQTLLQHEGAIRSDIRKLDEQAKVADSMADRTMTSIGADVIWKAWLGKTKRTLNMKLALVLAEKDQHMQQVRQAYGKVLASEELIATITAERRGTARKAELEKAIEMSVRQNAKNGPALDRRPGNLGR